jgi:hypothetical protein
LRRQSVGKRGGEMNLFWVVSAKGCTDLQV